MSLLGQAMSAVRGAWSGAIQGWNERSFNPVEFSGWDTFNARAMRYTWNQHYYNNSVYSSINTGLRTLKEQHKLYRHIRGVRNPAARLVDLYIAKIYGGMLDLETAKSGAVPIQADDAIREAIIPLWKTSNFAANKTVYVRHGAMLGDVFIKLVDIDAQYVAMEFLHPGKVVELKRNARGDIEHAILEYDVEQDTYGVYKTYRYREEITTETFATFKDGKPHDYADTGKVKWDNPYGFVPLVLAQHALTGLDFGMCAFHTSLRKIDELNSQASLLNDQIDKTVNVIHVVTGAKQTATIDMDVDEKDEIPLIYLTNPDAKITPLLANLDIEGTLHNIEAMEMELERDMPELSLHKVRDSSQGMSGISIRLMYSDAISRITQVMSNYDSALCEAQAMAIAMSAYHRYDRYRNFSLEDYRNDNLDHTVKPRTIFDDELAKSQKVQALATVSEQPPAIARLTLLELGYDVDTVEMVIQSLDEHQQNQAVMTARGFAESVFGKDEYGTSNSDDTSRAAEGANGNGNNRQQSAPETQTGAETARRGASEPRRPKA